MQYTILYWIVLNSCLKFIDFFIGAHQIKLLGYPRLNVIFTKASILKESRSCKIDCNIKY